MEIFKSGELEIAICTYNRSEYIKEWINKCYKPATDRNIKISIYDSSSDNETKDFISKFNIGKDEYNYIKYRKLPSETSIGCKPVYAMIESDAEYVWVSGDSRYHIFEELDETVFKAIKLGYEFILISAADNRENHGKVYSEKKEFLYDCLTSLTCIGMSIYKTDMFRRLRVDEKYLNQLDEKYKNNYGFGWIGYFLECFSEPEYKAYFCSIETKNVLERKKHQYWSKHFMKCWCQNLCELLDRIPECYGNVDRAIRKTWENINLDTLDYFYESKFDLTEEYFSFLFEKGYIQRCSKNVDMWRIVASISEDEIHLYSERDKQIRNVISDAKIHTMGIVLNTLSKESVFIYGLGKNGKKVIKFFKEAGVDIKGVIDKKYEGNKNFDGISFLSPDKIDRDSVVVVTPENIGVIGEIKSVLYKNGISDEKILVLNDCFQEAYADRWKVNNVKVSKKNAWSK